ncbi:uncharacterized protein N7446_007911 [Penicillium canescens]|uniref:Uncharacterized protein n=1 Tax=Penicillium canescens TaxID=5083 RepID=A0AAD6NDU6_PENCN|nr:uncharacterized protein N7446_007911 [Penicillium canescens]KAJ6033798.1 hypothetical protein N7444_011569 [Penicillium canescens]KAJ6057012.1 hypothetical protein N7460_000286 [Penicillium canescens]KAJ6058328.1 hypothetical protein N7446_007911 [Penicillium canescens]
MCSSASVEEFRKLLTVQEANQICHQFHDGQWLPGCQVMWSGVCRQLVQSWADRNGMQTLTTAMGSLMIHEHPQCLWSRKSSKQWSKYMKGASAMFAYHIAQDGDVVTVLSPPPPDRYNPYGGSNYQTLEEPILKGKLGPRVAKIEMVHPNILGAQDFRYQLWPQDQKNTWCDMFGHPSANIHWRHVAAHRSLL